MEYITQNWAELVLGILAISKIIVNLTPTEKDNEVFAKLDRLINFFIKDNVQGKK